VSVLNSVRPRHVAFVLPPLALLVAAVIVLLEGDLAADLSAAAGTAGRLVSRLGPAASFLGLYLEESGVPVPVSGDVFVVYLGHHFSISALELVGAWLGLVAVVVGGSSNLYFVSRRWGRRLAEGRLGMFLHLTPGRLAAAERWFDRWGVPAVIFGRHIIGFRVPITVAAGICRVPYHVFAMSVAVSTAVWAAAWMWVGVAFGDEVAQFLDDHRWAYALLFIGAALIVGGGAMGRHLRHRRQTRPAGPAESAKGADA